MHKTPLFSYNSPFFICFIPLVDIIGLKPTPSDYESNFKKEGAIPQVNPFKHEFKMSIPKVPSL